MEIWIDENGFYAQTNMEDFENNKRRRRYKRCLKKIRRRLRKMNKSNRYKELVGNFKTKIEHCKNCGSTSLIKWGVFWRKVRYFFHRRENNIPIQRYRCNNCGKSFSVSPKYITKHRWYSNKALQDMVDMKLWTYAGYRKVGNWGRIHGSSHTTVIREIINMAPVCKNALKSIVCKFSSIVCIDEVYFRKVKGIHYMGLAAVDARYGRIIYVETYQVKTPKVIKRFGDLESSSYQESKTECIKEFINELLQLADVKVIITDGNASYSQVIDEINDYRPHNKVIKHFLCTLHVLWEIDRAFHLSRFTKLSPTLKMMKELLHNAFNSNTLEEAEKKLDEALSRSYLVKGTHVEALFQMLSDNRHRLFSYLKYGINRTNNPVEHYNGFTKRFQHVSRKFASLNGIKSLLTVFALFYNFMPKMKGDNKGISPLQKAGWTIKMDMYEYVNYPRCVCNA